MPRRPRWASTSRAAAYSSKADFEARGCQAAKPGAAAAGLRLILKPRRAIAGRRTRFTFKVRRGERRVRGATVRFAGRRLRTGRRGRTRVKMTLRRTGVYRVRAKRGKLRSPVRRVRVVRRGYPRG